MSERSATVPPVLVLTEAFDPRAVHFIVKALRVKDLYTVSSAPQPRINPNGNYAKLQGCAGGAFNPELILTALKTQVAEWARHKGKVFYRYGSNFAAVKGGRLIASTGYQNWPKIVRSTLASGLYWDLDMVNAQPTLLAYLGQTHGWVAPTLQQYIENRDAVLDAHGGASCKEEVLAVLCGCREERVAHVPWLHALWKEVQAMQDACWEVPAYAPLKQGVQASQEAKRKKLGRLAAKAWNNEKGALLALVMQSKEREVLMELSAELSRRGRHMDTLIHDGGLVKKVAGETEFVLIPELQAHLESKFAGLGMKLAIKPWAEPWVIPPDDPVKPLRALKGVGPIYRALANMKHAAGTTTKKRKREKANSEAEEASQDGEDGAAHDENELAPGVSKDAYAVMKADFEKSHFYYVPTNAFVEVGPNGQLHYYQERHAKEYFDIRWAFGGWSNFRYRVSFLDLWRMDPLRRCIHRIDFMPSDDPGTYYMPLQFEYQRQVLPAGAPSEAVRARLLGIFDTLVNVASGNDAVLKEYVLNYFAHLIQKPLENPGVAIILTGQKGVGKDTLLDFMRLHVVGPALSHNYTETRQFFDKHDVDRKDKLFLKIEDSDSALCKQHAKDLRARITARESTINPKGKDPITYPNYARYFFTANQAIPVGINDDNEPERRFVILAVSNELKGNMAFFSECYNEESGLFTAVGGKVVADLLLARDISAFQVRVQPKNAYQDNMLEVERTPEQRFLEDCWPDGVEWTSAEAFHRYQTFCSEQQFHDKKTETAIGFGQKMAYFVLHKKLLKRVGGAKRVYYKKAPRTQEELEAAAAADAEDAERAEQNREAEEAAAAAYRASVFGNSYGAGAGAGAAGGFSAVSILR